VVDVELELEYILDPIDTLDSDADVDEVEVDRVFEIECEWVFLRNLCRLPVLNKLCVLFCPGEQ